MLGCSFDSFSPDWSDRSYIFVLIFLAWILPLGIIGTCYSQIIHSVSKNLFYLSKAQPKTSEIEQARKVISYRRHIDVVYKVDSVSNFEGRDLKAIIIIHLFCPF